MPGILLCLHDLVMEEHIVEIDVINALLEEESFLVSCGLGVGCNESHSLAKFLPLQFCCSSQLHLVNLFIRNFRRFTVSLNIVVLLSANANAVM